jgi:hypothetical protein
MSGHTQGPWWITDHGVRDRGGYIAHMNSVQRYEGQDERYAREVAQREADKRLIAASPELLAACKLFIAYDNNDATDGVAMMVAYNNAVTAARAAIAKAEGSKVGDAG